MLALSRNFTASTLPSSGRLGEPVVGVSTTAGALAELAGGAGILGWADRQAVARQAGPDMDVRAMRRDVTRSDAEARVLGA